MTRIPEHEALSLLASEGITTPAWELVCTPQEAMNVVAKWNNGAVLKALIPISGRQKAGLVRFTNTPREAERAASELLGCKIRGFRVSRLLVAERYHVIKEYFLSITFDDQLRSPVILFSREGGIDVESAVSGTQDLLTRQAVHIATGVDGIKALDLLNRAKIDEDRQKELAEFLKSAFRVFRSCDASVLEVNPIVWTQDQRLAAVAAVIDVDRQAAARQEVLLGKDGVIATNGGRALSSLEMAIRNIDLGTGEPGAIRFNEFPEGEIAIMVSGGGAGLVALDAINRAGGKPATSFDIKPGNIEEKMYECTLAILSRPEFKGLLVGGNFSNFAGVDVKARAVVRAVKEAGLDAHRFPIVMRFCGPNQHVAQELASSIPGVRFLDETFTIEDAAEEIVKLVDTIQGSE